MQRKISSALIVYKKSFWSETQHRKQLRDLPAAERHAWRRSHAQHEAALHEVQRVLDAEDIRYIASYRSSVQPVRRADVVITLGGDGTFLRASHRVLSTPVMGVNSDPQSSVGFFCCASRKNFRQRLRAYMDGQLGVVPLTRLTLNLNGRNVPELMLNDCLLTQRSPAATSRYLLQVRGRREIQASSGLWISTAAGSTAAVRSAGGYVLPLRSRTFQCVVREPSVRGKHAVRMQRMRIPVRGRVDVVSLMADGMLYIDGPHVGYPFRWGDRAIVQRSKHPLLAVGTSRSS
jgi:NAD+ kinase